MKNQHRRLHVQLSADLHRKLTNRLEQIAMYEKVKETKSLSLLV